MATHHSVLPKGEQDFCLSFSFFLFFFFFFKRLKKCGTEDSNVEEGEKYGQERGKCDSWAGSLFLFLFLGGVLPPGSGD